MQALNKELKLTEQCTFAKNPKLTQDEAPTNGIITSVEAKSNY